MGNISSRPDDPAALYLKDQTKLTIASLTITNYRGHAILHIGPNGFPATRVTAKRDTGDDTPIEFVLDPDSTTTSQPSFLLRLSNEDELTFKFSFIIRQTQIPPVTTSTINGVASTLPEAIDTTLKGVTFAHASNSKELDNLITREFHANPNLQNNSNVQHVGTFSTEGSPSIQFDWSWKWKPPKRAEDRGGGWRNCCSFLDYDERTNRLNTLATFTFWVQNATRPLSSPVVLSPRLELAVPPRNRTVSSQSVMSKGSELEALGDVPQSPIETESLLGGAAPAVPVKLDICQRPGEDMSAVEDGPLFRATMKALEQKTGNMRTKMKKLLKKAEAVHQRQVAYNESVSAFIIALNEASTSNANAIQPALEHYFDKIAKEILIWEQQNSTNLQKLIIDPLTRLYNNDIKQAESKKKDFEDESRDYYAYVGRYLGQRQDSLKEKKRAESDSKYQTKRRNFELKRFDYSSFMQDLHGGRKEQEVLSHLTNTLSPSTPQRFTALDKRSTLALPPPPLCWFWIVLDQGKLSEYSNWKQKLDLHMDPIDLRMASVREARNAERRFCFEVITPQFKRIYQATSEEDMGNWITAINNALQSAVESGRGVPPPPTSEGGSRKDIGSALMGKTTSSSNTSNVSRRTTVGARPSYVRNDSSYEDNPSKLLQVIREADQGNNWCADCNSASKVEWVSINLGIVLCIECSGIHRSLGTHISKIRSLTLDIHSFSNDIVEILLQIGNRVSNMIWEATLNPTHKPTAQSSRDQRLKFITAKYSERAFVRPLSSTLSRYGTADETLLASIKQNDIQGVLYGIALRASPNATDRSRNTHAVFLALAAADPASPSQSMTSISTWTKSAPQPPTGIKAIPFPIAELLVQNGADIPAEMPAIPLSPAAQLYVNQRTGRALGSGNPTASSGGDTLSALPTIRDFGSGGDGLMPSPAEMNNKERERLHKRGSAGARFAGKVTSFGS
ncbi:centaurin-beta-2 [Coccidioides immitis H538.4]|uniref:ADP-ribosylation factor GTPase-activating protein n=1 Tax=Coccidioides immitis H538.4 TaxID=396776 RepID=A0A0J8UWK1_COCIT|nr:centaurin-beta-2 [Coccidioides immitis H538.4]